MRRWRGTLQRNRRKGESQVKKHPPNSAIPFTLDYHGVIDRAILADMLTTYPAFSLHLSQSAKLSKTGTF